MKTRSLTEGAMLAALTVLLALLGVYFGVVGMLIPVPLTLLVYRHGFRTGVIVSFVAGAVSSLVLSSILMIIEILIIGVLGIALGMALREKFRFVQVILVGIGASLVAVLLKIYTYSLFFGRSLIDMYLESWQQSSQHWLTIWEQLGLSPEMIAQYEEMLNLIPVTMQLLFPTILLAIAAIRALINLFVVRLILKRLGDDMPWFPPFVTWRWPWYFVWGFILGRLFNILSLYLPGDIWSVIGVNLDVLFLYTFFIQGLAIAWFYLDKYQVHKALRILLVIFLFQPGSFLVLAIALVGILDTWFDFRKLKKKETEGKT